MRRAAALAALLALAASCASASSGGLPGARSIKVCAAAGPFWPTMTLALQGTTAWVACKTQSRIDPRQYEDGKDDEVDPAARAGDRGRVGLGSIWALDSGGTLYRINPKKAKITKRIGLSVAAAYNIWIGGGSVWVAADQGASVVRVSPASNRVVARIEAGDGPAEHGLRRRDRLGGQPPRHDLNRIDLAHERVQPVHHAGRRQRPRARADDVLPRQPVGHGPRHRPAEGESGDRLGRSETIEIGASGIDLVAVGDDIWVPTRSAAVDQSGFPTMDCAEARVHATGAVTTAARPTARLDVQRPRRGAAARSGSRTTASGASTGSRPDEPQALPGGLGGRRGRRGRAGRRLGPERLREGAVET